MSFLPPSDTSHLRFKPLCLTTVHVINMCVCVCVCVSLTMRKQAWAVDTKLDRHTMHGSRSAWIDTEVKGRGYKVYRLLSVWVWLIDWLIGWHWWSGDGWRETMSQDRHDRAAAADTGRPQGRPATSRGQRGGWGPRSSRGARRPQCTLSVMF